MMYFIYFIELLNIQESAGIVPKLIKLLESTNKEMVWNSIRVLTNLTSTETECETRSILVVNNVVPTLVGLVKETTNEAQLLQVLGLIENILFDSKNEMCQSAFRAAELLPQLLRLLLLQKNVAILSSTLEIIISYTDYFDHKTEFCIGNRGFKVFEHFFSAWTDDPSLLSHALCVLTGIAVLPEAIQALLGFSPTLINIMVNKSDNHLVALQTLYLISAMLQSNEIARKYFVSMGALKVVSKYLDSPEDLLRGTAAEILANLFI